MSGGPRTVTPMPVVKPELYNGDHMAQPEFHRIYEQLPEDFRAELIGGIVYVGGRVKIIHGQYTIRIAAMLSCYDAHTPGTAGAIRSTVILGNDSEVHPDLMLLIDPDAGGQWRENEDGYIAGPPELIVEVALNHRSIDFHAKFRDYQRYGVREYLVLNVRDRELRWFDLRSDQELEADANGVYRIRSFPGLWIHREALLQQDYPGMMAVLNQGLATSEHAAFVQKLAARRRQ